MSLSGPNYNPGLNYKPGTSDWVRFQQAELYVKSGGTEGNIIFDAPIIVVTSIGAKSGAARRIGVMRVEHDGKYAIVASLGGGPRNPSWYHNVIKNPRVILQDSAESHPRSARLLEGDERADWWRRAVEAFPRYAEYEVTASSAGRIIPVFVLERAEMDDAERERYRVE